MMVDETPDPELTIEELLQDAGWVRAVARSMVGTADAAEDLVQEAWLFALRRRGTAKSRGTTRGWVAGLLRNLARHRSRKDARRLQREWAAAQDGDEEEPTTEELVLRAEAQQLVARTVLELEEPLRSTLLLSYFEGLTTEQIAARHDVRPDTVRARLRRGIAQLKERLADHEEGGWQSVCALVLPFRVSPALPAAGAILGIEHYALIATLILAGSGWLILRTPEQASDMAEHTAAPELETNVAALDAVEREPEGVNARTTAIESSTTEALVRVHGSLTLRLPDGQTLDGGSGSFQRSDASRASVRFEGGLWEVFARPGEEIAIGALTLESPTPRRRALEELGWRGVVPDDAQEEWRVALPQIDLEPIAVVHAVAQENGRELPAAELLVIERVGLPPLMNDAARRAGVRASGTSPLIMPVRDDELADAEAWVGGRNRTWSRVELPRNTDSEHWIELAAAGELELRFEGEGLPAGSDLRLEQLDLPRGIRVDDAGGWYGRPKPGTRLLLTGLVAGEYSVNLEFAPIRAEWPLTRELGRAKALVHAGERTKLAMRCESIEPTLAIDPILDIVVPPAWALDQFYFRIYPLRAGRSFNKLEWTAATLSLDANGKGSVRPRALSTGIYLFEFFTLRRVSHLALVTLDGSSSRIEFRVPPPVEVRLWVTERTSGAVLEVAKVSVGPPSLEGASGRVTVLPAPTAGPEGAVHFDVPAGPQRLFVSLADGRFVREQIEASGTRTDVFVEVD